MSAVVNTVTVGTVHQLKVTLRGVRPPVWRRVHVPSAANLAELHEAIQVVFGWQQHHLHVFRGDRTGAHRPPGPLLGSAEQRP
ncbi:plasmid pRiA4b ORF-3 family protein [Nonomuraea sp. bgisy101]|uniref:plasmid pRiA4b ORF-3 family protein n=1 Tax=Nonomuraea sp. bgisy101 TaxID=3413784 RepID=UPI003D746ADD